MGGRLHSRYKEMYVVKEVKGSNMFVIYKVSIFEKAEEVSKGEGVEGLVFHVRGLMLILREESNAIMHPPPLPSSHGSFFHLFLLLTTQKCLKSMYTVCICISFQCSSASFYLNNIVFTTFLLGVRGNKKQTKQNKIYQKTKPNQKAVECVAHRC